MKIFLPFQQDLNPYLDEIERYANLDFVYASYTAYQNFYPIVNIHWPEAIFDWVEPSSTQLDALEKEIEKWKKYSRIVYTVHDESRHKGMTSNFSRLFKMVESNADLFIHLGKHSCEKYLKIYPNAKHRIIYHPVYTYNSIEKTLARRKLGIDNDALVFIVPGHIRNKEEKRLVLRAFNSFPVEKKVLIATRMRNEMEFDFKGRIRLKKIFDLQKFILDTFRRKHQPPTYLFDYYRASEERICLTMSASDIVIIPRINTLNSGILFLGMAFNKVVVGPGVGNIREHLQTLGYPIFNPASSKSLLKSLKKAVNLYEDGFKVEPHSKAKYKPEIIAKQFEDTFKELVQ